MDFFFLVTAAALGPAYGQYAAGKQQQYEYERQADQEEMAAESRELERRQKLNKVLSANVVAQSMSGISGEGTPQSIALESAKQASLSEGITSLSNKLKVAQLRRQGKMAGKSGKLAAASTLLNTAESITRLG